MPPGGRPARAAAHRWVPAGPGEPHRPCRLPAQEEIETLRLHVGRATRNLEAGCTGAPGELEARTRARTWSRSPDAASKKSARKDPFAPGRGHAEPAGRETRVRGPSCGRRLASRPRRGPSGQPPARRRGRPPGPRGANGRNGRAVGEVAGSQGPEAGRAAGPAPSRARPAAQPRSSPPQSAGASLSRAGGRGKEPGLLVLRRAETAAPESRAAWPANKHRRARRRQSGGVADDSRPPSRGRAQSNGRRQGDLRFPAACASAVVGW